MKLTKKDKLDIMKTLNWDYNVKPENMLKVVQGKQDIAGVFTREKLLIRCLERISWHRIIALWGIDSIMKLYSPTLLKQIHIKELRSRYEIVFGLLRNEPVSVPDWGSEYCKKMQHAFLSDRWNRS